MRGMLIGIVLLIAPFFASGQDSAIACWFQFSDKANSPYSKLNPEAYLSEEAIKRREKQDIPIDSLDLPVNPGYKQKLEKQTDGVTLVSKWLNGVVAKISDTLMLQNARSLPFVDTAYRVSGNGLTPARRNGRKPKSNNSPEYGRAFHQVEMLNGQFLHQLGYQGEGSDIAVLDAGFNKLNQLKAFEHLKSGNQIGYQENFVNPNKPVTNEGSHGTAVLSAMAARLPDVYTGVAPKADYHLFKSENTNSEYLVEEIAWVAAAEAADSAGALVINSSLGYTRFDDSTTDHTYDHLDGATTFVTTGAEIAFDKGMLVVNSAGNKGRSEWQYISAPADGKTVLTVGAVDSSGKRVAFSSIGPTADGRIKPDIMAMGAKTVVIGLKEGRPAVTYGTSFSAPLISGLTACLWQAFPNVSNAEIRNAIVKSGNQAENPDTVNGNGIPDFYEAYVYLQNQKPGYQKESHLVRLYPNPFMDHLKIGFYSPEESEMNLSIKSTVGRTVFSKQISLNDGFNRIQIRDIPAVKSGVYILNLTNDRIQISRKLLHH